MACMSSLTFCPAFLQDSRRRLTGSAPTAPAFVNFFVITTIFPWSIELCSTGKLKQKPKCSSSSSDLKYQSSKS